MEEYNKVGKNIKSLARAIKESPKSIAWKLDIAEGTMYDVINGKQKASRPFLDKLASYFGVSPEAIMNDDFSGLNLLVDPALFANNIFTLLPLQVSDEAMKDPRFAKAYNSQRQLYDAEKEMKLLDPERSQKLVQDCFEYYEIISSGEGPDETVVNAISLDFYLLLYAKAIETISRYAYHEENYPAVLEKMKEKNLEFKKMIESVEESDLLKDVTPFYDMVHDDNDNSIEIELLCLNSANEWKDLADYYVCLQYVFGAVDNNFTFEQNHEFGIELMIKYAAMENEYTEKYLSIMDLRQ